MLEPQRQDVDQELPAPASCALFSQVIQPSVVENPSSHGRDEHLVHRVGEYLGPGRRDVIPGVGPHHGDVPLLEEWQQLRERPGRTGDVGIDRSAALPLAELPCAQQQHIALPDLEPALSLGFFDIRQAHPVSALDEINPAHARRIHQHAARDDAFVRHGNVALGSAFAHLHRGRWPSVVHVPVPHEVGVAVDVCDGVAVKDQAKVVHRHLSARTVARPVRLSCAHHEVDGRSRHIWRRLVEDQGSGAAYGQSVLDQRQGAFGQLRGKVVERTQLIVVTPAPPVGERVDPSK